MVEEQKSPGIEALKTELAEIKREKMRNELEEIKREKMRQELEEMKAERAAGATQQHYVRNTPRHTPKLSILTAIMAVLALLVAGYMLGTVYGYNFAGDVDQYLASFGLPAIGSIIVAIAGIVLALIGTGLMAMAKK
jgi:predicted phage tail protein